MAAWIVCGEKPMSDYNRSEQIKQVHAERRKATDQKANDAIDVLLKNKQPINFNKVSELSGISVATLYKHEEIRQRIEYLRQQLKSLPSPREMKNNTSDDGKDAIIASLKRKIQKLEQENATLRKANEKALADAFDVL